MTKPYTEQDLEVIREYPKLATDVERWLETVDTLKAHYEGLIDNLIDELARVTSENRVDEVITSLYDI